MTREQFSSLETCDVVQIDPAHDARFGGTFLVVTELKSWGVQGYVPMGAYMGTDAAGAGDPSPRACQAFYRVALERIEYVGKAAWDTAHEEEDE